MRLATAVAMAAAAGAAAILAAGPAEGGGEECLQAAAAAAAKDGAPAPTLDRLLFFATLEGLCEDAIPDAAADAALEKDGNGNYRNFVHGCPICHPVIEGFRAYLMRSRFYHGRKGDPYLGGGEDEASKALAARLAGEDRAARGEAIHDLVTRWTERQMARLRMTDAERAGWRQRFAEGRKKGMSRLSSSEGFAFKSCPSCDGAANYDGPR